MARYHVNPTTGNTGICTAKEGNCPLGSPETNPHFSSAEDARGHAEALMAEKYGRQTAAPPAEDPNQLAFFTAEEIAGANERKLSDEVVWEDYDELKKKDPTLARPDVDFGFNWSTNSGQAGTGRVSLAKWYDDPTGTLYVYHGENRAAVLAHNITEEEVDKAWHELLAEKTTHSTSLDGLLTKLRRNNG